MSYIYTACVHVCPVVYWNNSSESFWNGVPALLWVESHSDTILFFSYTLFFTLPQPTGTLLGLSWSSLPCHALLASLQESYLLPISLPIRGSTAPLLPGSCSLFQVSSRIFHSHQIICSLYSINYVYLYFVGESQRQNRAVPVIPFISIISFHSLFYTSTLCSPCNGHLHWGDRELPGQALRRLALLLVLYTRLGGTAHDFLCWLVHLEMLLLCCQMKSLILMKNVLIIISIMLCFSVY